MMLVGAKAHFCASHTLPQHKDMHGHSYEVLAYVPEGECAEALQRRLRRACNTLDHKHLNIELGGTTPATMENIARHLAKRLKGVVRIVVLRPVEGLCAEWTA